jgi:hypothetical protein
MSLEELSTLYSTAFVALRHAQDARDRAESAMQNAERAVQAATTLRDAIRRLWEEAAARESAK